MYKKRFIIFLSMPLFLLATAGSSLAQNKFKEGKGVFIPALNELGYKFNDHIGTSVHFGNDVYDRDRFKIGITGIYTNYIDKKKSWGYDLNLSLSSLTEPTSRNSIFTPVFSPSVFKRISISNAVELLPTVGTFVTFPEMNNTAYGVSFSIPVSIKIFGDRRLVIGPGIEIGHTNVNFRTTGLLGLILGVTF